MRVLKFGGTSLANAERFYNVVNIIEQKIKMEQIIIVLSAPAKITNYLNNAIQEELNLKNKTSFNKITSILDKLLIHINVKQKNFPYQFVKQIINNELSIVKNLLKEINLLNTCNDITKSTIICKGEIISVAIMKEILQSRNHSVTIINPIDNLIAYGNKLNAEVDITETTIQLKKLNIPKSHIILMAGFIAGNKNKELQLLGRNGSDYSATILAACLKANYCEIWTDVNGIYTCDPKIVPNALLLKNITYQEALQLSHCGANVLHPKTINPILNHNIPCIIKNTLNPNSFGTVINHKTDSNISVKGITYINNIALLKIQNIKSDYISKIISRTYKSITNNNIEILLLIKSSSNEDISIFFSKHNLDKITNILKKEFYFELQKNYIKPLCIIQNLSKLSIIMNDINKNKNHISKVFKVLHQLNINIYSTIQEHSHNTLSIILETTNVINAIKTIHATIYDNCQLIELFLIGIGGIGKNLIKQINKQNTLLRKQHIILKICGIANSKLLLTDINGICLNNWLPSLKKTGIPFNVQTIIQFIKKNFLKNPVLVDCTSNLEIAHTYPNFISNGCHIVTPNKKANTDDISYYKKIRKLTLKYNKKFLYETNVGAGLPVIENLQKLLTSGDSLIKFKGILSGSLSFIFGKLDEGISLSQATLEAQKLGFTEPNPRDDLSGIDVARKLLILAREVGFNINLQDIEIESIFPNDFNEINNSNNFIQELSLLDNIFYHRVKIAKKSGQVLRFIGTIEKQGHCKVKIENININDPLYSVKNGENALSLYSKYYTPIPLVLRGYGAGNEVTAAGVFSDILRIL